MNMNDDDLNLPQRKVLIPEVVNSTKKKIEKFQFTEKQVEAIVSDVGQIVKDIVAIARIREESVVKVNEIEAETRKIVRTVRVEIDRLAQVGRNTKTRGQVAAEILAQITNSLKVLPDHDDGSRHRLIDSITTIIDLAMRKE
jgi:hypothetical protein